MDNPNAENPNGTTTLEQPVAQTATPQVLETPTFEASPTTATPPSQENVSVTPQQAPIAETTNASIPQAEQKKGFFSRILGGRGGNLIPSPQSQEDPATHNAVFQERQGEIQTSNASVPDHLADGTTPKMEMVEPQAEANAQNPVSAPKFSQEALNSAPAESTTPPPPVLPTEHPETSTLETTSAQVLDEAPTPTATVDEHPEPAVQPTAEITNPEPVSQPIQPLEPRETAGSKPEIPITQPLNSIEEPAVAPVEATVVEAQQAIVEPLDSTTAPTDQVATPDLTPTPNPDTMTPTNPDPLETPGVTPTPTGDILAQAADVATNAEAEGGSLPVDGAVPKALESTEPVAGTLGNENLNPTATADVDTALGVGGIDSLGSVPTETPTLEPATPDNNVDSSNENSGAGTPPTPQAV